MNLYQLHSNPEQLYGFDILLYKIPELAFDLAIKRKDLRSKLEPSFIKKPYWAYRYALHNYERWPEAEPYIMKDPEYACYYAEEFFDGIWLEAEPYIKRNPYWWDYYSSINKYI